MIRTLGILSATAIAALALGATLCLAQTHTSAFVALPTVPHAPVTIGGAVTYRSGPTASGPQITTIPIARASGLRGTSSDPLPPPGFWDPVKAWIRAHHPLLGQLAIAQMLVLLLVSGTLFWVTHRRRA